MKPTLLMMFYVDMSSQKGDSIRTREIVAAMSETYDVRFIGINSPRTIGSAHCYNVPKSRKGLALLWNFFSLLYGLYCVLRFRPQGIYADSPSGSLSPALISLLARKPLFLEIHGPVGSCDVSLYRARTSFHIIMASWMERVMLCRASLVIGAKGWTRLAQDIYRVPDDRIVNTLLPVNHKLFRPRNLKECRRKLNLPADAPVAVFIGNVAPWQGLETLVQAAPAVLAEHRDAIFMIVGDGSARADLRCQAENLKVAHAFRFVGGVPYEEVPDYIGASNAGVAIFPGNRGNRGGISAHKTRNYLAGGRPVVVSDMDEMADTIEQKGAGMSVPPDDADALSRALLFVFGHSQNENELRDNAARLGATLPSWDDHVAIVSARMRNHVVLKQPVTVRRVTGSEGCENRGHPR
jgi:glycosyltransferase involved in cell wall biosynthesis